MMRANARSEDFQLLWLNRFSSAPLYCGRDAEPGIDEMPEWRDWSKIDTTPDQKRIESVLEELGVEGRTILHIGAGNSKFAERFSSRARYILGTTICQGERWHAESLKLANYEIVVHNKYSEDRVAGRYDTYDFIIDNNPTTFCCCWRHLGIMMQHYAALLSPSGLLLTDKVGLGWVTSDPSANPRWSFTYEDWEATGRAFNLKASRLNEFVYSLAPPSSRSLAAARTLRRLARIAPRRT